MIFITFRVTYEGITPGTIQWDLTGINKYCVIYENENNFEKMNLLKITLKCYKRLVNGPASTEKYVLTLY